MKRFGIAMLIIMTFILSCHLSLNARSGSSRRDRNFNAQNRIYTYLGLNVFSFTELGLDATGVQPGTTLVPALGIGFSLINFNQGRAFLNLEADYTKGMFAYDHSHQRSASALTLICQGELTLGHRNRLSGYLGMGVGILNLGSLSRPGMEDSSIVVSSRNRSSMALELGLKYSLMPHLMMRIGSRFYVLVSDTGYGYWDDINEIWIDDSEYDLLASSLTLSMEFHF